MTIDSSRDDSGEQVSPGWPEFEDSSQLEHVLDIISKESGIDREKLTPDATLDTLGIASMDLVMILMGVEEQLEVYIPMAGELSSAKTLADLMGAIADAARKGAARPEAASA